MPEVIVQNFIGGSFVSSSLTLDSNDPSTGQVWAHVPDSTAAEVDAAVQAAKAAFPKWSNTATEERSTILMRIADILESRLEEFAKMESRDQGKPISLAIKMDIPRAVYNFRFFATAILHHLEISHFQDQMSALNYTSRSPVGVAGLISPWNLPIYLLTFKLAPAIATGNTVVAKPSELTSVTAWMLCQVLKEAGLPDGVVNMVFGSGPYAGEALVRHPDVNLVSFTGSTATAVRIQQAAAQYTKKLSLELGGKNPAIIFKDVDLEKCLPTTVRSCFTNQGEICLCTSRIFVQRDLFDKFVDRFVAETRKIRVGDPRSPTTDMGALVSKDHLNKVRGFIGIAQQEGATIHCGATVDDLDLPTECQQGYFMLPTVITGANDNSPLMQQEIFGPVVCISPFDTEEEVIERANNVIYGLSASVWTTDSSRIHRVAKKLQAGTVWCNCWLIRDLNMPFGGVKGSGIGREGLQDSIDFYTEVKTVCIKV